MNKKFLLVSLFSISWALNIVLSRLILNRGLPPLSLNFQTLFVSILFIAIYLIYSTPQALHTGSRKGHLVAIISGIIGGGLANIFSLQGLQLSTATNYGFLAKTAGVFNVLASFVLLREPITKAKGILLGFMLAGAYLLSTNGKIISPHLGDILIIFGSLGFGIASALNRLVIKNGLHPNLVSLYRAGFGFLITFIAASLFQFLTLRLDLALLIFINGFLGALIYIFLNKTLSVASSSYLGMMSMSVPVVVALIAIPLFGDSLSPIQWVGGGMIVLGGILTEIKKVAHHD